MTVSRFTIRPMPRVTCLTGGTAMVTGYAVTATIFMSFLAPVSDQTKFIDN